MIGMALAVALVTETWTCFVEPRDPSYEGYRTTYVVTDNQVIETRPSLTFSYGILANNDRALVFASSNFGVDDFTGTRIDQMATVIAIDRTTETMRRTFLQEDGTKLERVDGNCVKSVV